MMGITKLIDFAASTAAGDPCASGARDGSQTGGDDGLVRRSDLDAFLRPALDQAAADGVHCRDAKLAVPPTSCAPLGSHCALPGGTYADRRRATEVERRGWSLVGWIRTDARSPGPSPWRAPRRLGRARGHRVRLSGENVSQPGLEGVQQEALHLGRAWQLQGLAG